MNQIKAYRTKLGQTQAELASACNVKQNTVSAWETGRSEPDFESLKKMADIFNCSLDELLGQKEKPVVKDDRLNRKLELLNDESIKEAYLGKK